MTRVGWLGLGAMGAPMARQLAKSGHEVFGYDIDSARLASLASDGIRATASPAEAAEGAEVLAVMVATPAQVSDVLFGSGGAAAVLPPSAVLLVMATIGPEAISAVADRLARRGVAVVDAPVSGGVARAATGDLLFMVSGEPGPVAAVRHLVDAMAAHVADAGQAVGDGQRLKLVNQLLCGVHIAAAAEALAFAEAMGLDPGTCWETLRHGAAGSFMLDDRGARMLSGDFAEVRSALSIFVKDMGMVVGAARHNSFPSPLAAVAEQLYLGAARAGLGHCDDSVLIEVLRGSQPSPGRRAPSS
jgi:3-hydroxyisobutyrate dehydrogenase